jgi:hypothetical protein
MTKNKEETGSTAQQDENTVKEVKTNEKETSLESRGQKLKSHQKRRADVRRTEYRQAGRSKSGLLRREEHATGLVNLERRVVAQIRN